MADIVPVAELSIDAKPIVDDLRARLSSLFGVTLQGSHLSVRWQLNGNLVQVVMIIDAVDDGEDDLDPESIQ